MTKKSEGTCKCYRLFLTGREENIPWIEMSKQQPVLNMGDINGLQKINNSLGLSIPGNGIASKYYFAIDYVIHHSKKILIKKVKFAII